MSADTPSNGSTSLGLYPPKPEGSTHALISWNLSRHESTSPSGPPMKSSTTVTKGAAGMPRGFSTMGRPAPAASWAEEEEDAGADMLVREDRERRDAKEAG